MSDASSCAAWLLPAPDARGHVSRAAWLARRVSDAAGSSWAFDVLFELPLFSDVLVGTGLQSFLESTGVDELMITSHIYALEAKMRCYELVAALFDTN